MEEEEGKEGRRRRRRRKKKEVEEKKKEEKGGGGEGEGRCEGTSVGGREQSAGERKQTVVIKLKTQRADMFSPGKFKAPTLRPLKMDRN